MQGAQRIVVLTRNLNRARDMFPNSDFPLVQIVRFDSAEQATVLTDQQLANVISQCNVVINLAGESLSEGGEGRTAMVGSRGLVCMGLSECDLKRESRTWLFLLWCPY